MILPEKMGRTRKRRPTYMAGGLCSSAGRESGRTRRPPPKKVGDETMWIWYVLAAAAVALGLWAAWLSGRDVGMRNAARRAEEDAEPTVMLKIETKGETEHGRESDEV